MVSDFSSEGVQLKGHAVLPVLQTTGTDVQGKACRVTVHRNYFYVSKANCGFSVSKPT